MNIWILNHYAITSDMTGSTRHYDFAIELIKKGYSVTIFSSSFRHQGKREESKLRKNEKYKIENIDGINFVWIKTFSYKKNDWRRLVGMIHFMCRAYWLGRKIIKLNSEIKKPHIIYGSSPHLLAILSAHWLSKYYKTKFIMEVRDLWPQTFVDMGKIKENNPIIKILRILEKSLYKRAKKIIVLLPRADKYIVSLGINKNKIIWIPNGVNLKSYGKMISTNMVKKYFKVMYVGGLTKGDSLSVILNAAKIIQDKRYNNIKFIFIGDGIEKQNLIKYKNKLDLKNTEFYKSMPKKKIPIILNNTNILIISQQAIDLYKYGFSYNKLFDYMASAKPILLAGNPINNLIDISNCGITVPPENPEKMAEAIIKLYNMSPEERQKMGKNGRKYVEKYNSIPVLVDKLEKVFKEINN